MAFSPITTGLLGLYEADAASSGASLENSSGAMGDFSAASTAPALNPSGLNGKKTIVFDGSAAPLTLTESRRIGSLYLVVKINSLFSGAGGVLSTLSQPILQGVSGTDKFEDNSRENYQYRLNDRIRGAAESWTGGRMKQIHRPLAPVGAWGIVYLRFHSGLAIDGLQIGQDRNFTGSRLPMELALLAVYDHNTGFCESDVRTMHQRLSSYYNLPITEVLPFNSQKADQKQIGKRVLSDGQNDPITRVKDIQRKKMSLSFEFKDSTETRSFFAFRDYFHPSKAFLYRDLGFIPPEDTVVKFKPESDSDYVPNFKLSAFTAELVQSTDEPEQYIAGTDTVVVTPDPDPDTELILDGGAPDTNFDTVYDGGELT